MRNLRHFARPGLALALLAGLALAAGAAPAGATILAPAHGGQPVNVNVGFNTQVPLADLSQETLAAAQKAGREYLYRLGSEECVLLKATIAETCRLTSLNINTNIQQNYNTAQPLLYINGNASFTISLKGDAPVGD
jgi:hypothetical protein